jgi:hypothetical protein
LPVTIQRLRHERIAIAALLVAGAFGCGVGDATGGDATGDETDGDGTSDDGTSGDGSGALQCATAYSLGGSVAHDVPPAGACEGSGLWDVTASDPRAATDQEACGGAPDGEAFRFTVAREGGRYVASDEDDPSREWNVQIRDKGGSCSATFEHAAGDGTGWALIAGEEGAGGTLDGTARFERRGG